MTTDADVTQAAALTLEALDADSRASQSVLLALYGPSPDHDITQSAMLAMQQVPANVEITQVAVLSLVRAPDYVEAAGEFAAGRSSETGIYSNDACTTESRECQCWKITRKDGGVFAYTTHDEDVIYAGTLYKRCDSLRATAASGTVASGTSTGDIQAAGILSDAGVSAADLYAGRFDDASVVVHLVDWQTLYGRPLTRGIVSRTKQGENNYTLTALTGGARLEQQPLLEVFSPLCRYNLGDARCKFNVEATRVSGTVDTVPLANVVTQTRRRKFYDAARTEPVETYRNARLTWTSGANTGLTFEVKDIVSGTVTMWIPCPLDIQPGDGYTIIPGCGKTKDDCTTRFNNYINFGGFPDLPGNDALNNVPNRTTLVEG